MGQKPTMTDARGEAIDKELAERPGMDREELCKSYKVTLRTYQRWKAKKKAQEEA